MENGKKNNMDVDYFEDLTGDIPAPGQGGVDEIGERVKRIREQKGLTLNQLARLTGFEESLLADIEGAKAQPQLGTVIKLSKALDSAFGKIVSGSGDKPYAISRKGEHKIVSRSTAAQGSRQIYTYKSLAPEVKGRHMEAFMVQLEENPEGEMSIHEGEEFIYVLDGVVSLKIAEDYFELDPGDSIYYLSTTPHLIAAKSSRATIIAVLYEG
jgi:transcriptional regulator with XRE-family HTH domain